MVSIPPEYNYFNTSYRNDVSRWGGITHKKPENISREIDLRRASGESSTVARCIESMTTECRPVTTPNSLYQDSYVPHVPYARGITATHNLRCPPSPAVPEAPSPEVLRPTTEYTSNYKFKRPQAFLRPELVELCSRAQEAARAIGSDGRLNPNWDTSYRRHYCERATLPHTSEAVTFHGYTGMR
jgi:hypothetical protein